MENWTAISRLSKLMFTDLIVIRIFICINFSRKVRTPYLFHFSNLILFMPTDPPAINYPLPAATNCQPDTRLNTRCQRVEQRRGNGEAAFKQATSGGRIRQRLGCEL